MLEKIAPTPLGRNPPCVRQVADVEALVGPQAEDEQGSEHEEDDDRGDLDAGEPVLELAVGGHGDQVGGGHQHHQAEGEQPQRRVEPVRDDLGARDGLEADHDDPEVPVEPRHREARPAPERHPGVVGEGAGGRVRRGHLAEHPHHQDDQATGDQVGEEGSRSGFGDHGAGAHEEAGSDDAADGDHREVPLLEALAQLAGPGRGPRGLRLDGVGHEASSCQRHPRWPRTSIPTSTSVGPQPSVRGRRAGRRTAASSPTLLACARPSEAPPSPRSAWPC